MIVVVVVDFLLPSLLFLNSSVNQSRNFGSGSFMALDFGDRRLTRKPKM